MIKTIPVNRLKVGMYVNLPLSWLSHSFLKNKFSITSRSQLQKIIQSNLKEIKIDTSLGADMDDGEDMGKGGAEMAKKVVPEVLREVIHDPRLAPVKKARAIRNHSREMMKNLMESPTSGNIVAVTRAISEIVELILTDNETSIYLLDITSHDYATYTHSVNVGIISISLAKALYRRSNGHDMHALGAGFFLHDLGKVRIDQSIINKPGILNDEEWLDMRRHPDYGFQILNETDNLNKESRIIVLQHHERDNGSGYPLGIKGADIHPYGRICSVADVYDALTSLRPYKPKIKPFEALRIMQKEMIDHFQRDVFECFVVMLAALKKN